MPKFSNRSRENLSTCDPRLQKLFWEVIKTFNCTIIQGHRNEIQQNEYYKNGRSKLQWPKSKHNRWPSLAVDVAPSPINWQDTNRFYYFSGYVKGIARMMEIPIRWGGDWDDDTNTFEERFKDLVHFELPEKKGGKK